MREVAVRSVAKLRVVWPCSFKVAAEGSIARNVQGIGCNLPPETLCCWLLCSTTSSLYSGRWFLLLVGQLMRD